MNEELTIGVDYEMTVTGMSGDFLYGHVETEEAIVDTAIHASEITNFRSAPLYLIFSNGEKIRGRCFSDHKGRTTLSPLRMDYNSYDRAKDDADGNYGAISMNFCTIAGKFAIFRYGDAIQPFNIHKLTWHGFCTVMKAMVTRNAVEMWIRNVNPEEGMMHFTLMPNSRQRAIIDQGKEFEWQVIEKNMCHALLVNRGVVSEVRRTAALQAGVEWHHFKKGRLIYGTVEGYDTEAKKVRIAVTGHVTKTGDASSRERATAGRTVSHLKGRIINLIAEGSWKEVYETARKVIEYGKIMEYEKEATEAGQARGVTP